jgi:hypothetical protein
MELTSSLGTCRKSFCLPYSWNLGILFGYQYHEGCKTESKSETFLPHTAWQQQFDQDGSWDWRSSPHIEFEYNESKCACLKYLSCPQRLSFFWLGTTSKCHCRQNLLFVGPNQDKASVIWRAHLPINTRRARLLPSRLWMALRYEVSIYDRSFGRYAQLHSLKVKRYLYGCSWEALIWHRHSGTSTRTFALGTILTLSSSKITGVISSNRWNLNANFAKL